MAKTRTTDVAVAETPAELPEPTPAPPPAPTPEPEPEMAPVANHTALHGTDSIVSDEKSYHLWVSGRRYVHVGEHAGQWVYRPD